MVAKHVSDVVGRDHQGVPSLVDVLCTLAANWVLCECGVEIGRAGLDGWKEKGLQLGEKIDLLNVQIPLIESPTKKALFEAELEQLEAEAEALNEEWGQACDEANACCELFWNARKFCTRACGFGDNELFNAALVGFDPERLKPGQGPSNHRMSKISSRLTNLHRDKWKTQPWANPTKPTMRAARRVAPDKVNSFMNGDSPETLNSFIIRNLQSEAGKSKHVGKMSDPPGQGNPMKGLNAGGEIDEQAPKKWLSPRSVSDLIQETGCGRSTINDDVKDGNIPGGARRENNKPRGNVILQQTGLDYLKRKGGKDK